MTGRTRKHGASLFPPHTSVTRRHFIGSAAALAGGVVVENLISGPAWAAPPNKVDLTAFPVNTTTTVNYITPVKNQNTCNACTAFAVVAAIEGAYNRTKNPNDDDKGLNLSEGQLFFAAGPRAKCSATHWWPEDALAYCTQVGLTREDTNEFVGTGNTLIKAKGTKLLRPKLKDTQDLMKAWLSDRKLPIVAVMAEYSDFFKFKGGDIAYYPGVVYPNSPPSPPYFVGGHVVAIVGYDDASKTWICKNSYGESWNDTAWKKGYVKIAQGGTQDDDCYIDSIDVWGVSII
jgi:hypothetical protein